MGLFSFGLSIDWGFRHTKFPTVHLGISRGLNKSRTCPQSWSSDGIPEGKLVLQKTTALFVRQHSKLCGNGF